MNIKKLCTEILQCKTTEDLTKLKACANEFLAQESLKGTTKINIVPALKRFLKKAPDRYSKIFDYEKCSIVANSYAMIIYNFNIDPQGLYNHEPALGIIQRVLADARHQDYNDPVVITQRRLRYYKVLYEFVSVDQSVFSLDLLIKVTQLTGDIQLAAIKGAAAYPSKFYGENLWGLVCPVHNAPPEKAIEYKGE